MTNNEIPQFSPSDQNPQSPNKYLLAIHKFPNTRFFIQEANIPGFATNFTVIPTGAFSNYHELGDKMVFNDFHVSLILDEQFSAFKEIYNWSYSAMTESRINFKPFSDMTVISLDNNSNSTNLFKLHFAFPAQMSDVSLSVKRNDDTPITLDLLFKYAYYTVDD